VYDEMNELYTCDYNPDGTMFCSGGSDSIIRVYDEQTRGLICALEGG